MTKMPWSNKHGLLHRLREAWWVLSGKWSLHRAFQSGLDQGSALEYRRLIINGAAIIEMRGRDPSYVERPPISRLRSIA